MKVRVVLAVAVLLMGFAFTSNSIARAQDGGLCATAGNLIQNCGFDKFKSFFLDSISLGGRIGANWNAFVISGRPDFTDAGCDSPDCPAQRIWSDGQTWNAGIYQQANVTAGQGYRAEVGWFTPRCPQAGTDGRIGIDPMGGTDPRSANILWSNYSQLQKSMHHRISAAARGGTATVFVEARISANCSQREANGSLIVGNIVWIDAVILAPDNSVTPAPTLTPTSPAATNTPVPLPVNTRAPATSTSTRAAATNAPAAPTATATTSATATTVATNSSTAMPSDSPTPVPASTRHPTSTPTDASLAFNSGDLLGPSAMTVGLLGASGCTLMLSFVLGGAALWLWRRK